MRLIFTLEATLISKIVAFGTQKTQKYYWNEFSWPGMEDMDVDDVYFRQNGATCHTSCETFGLLREKFPGRVISQYGDYNWPPRSCDLTPLDFFLWGYVKDRVYAHAPQSIQEPKEKICALIDEIKPHMYENVIKNVIKRTSQVQI